MYCYREFAYSFGWKVRAARHVLNYQWGKDIAELDTAVTLLTKSLAHYRRLVSLTKDAYLYANSMQTAQRRIPIGGDDGKMKTWEELLPKYEQELQNLKKNIAQLRAKEEGLYEEKEETIKALTPADITLEGDYTTVTLDKGVRLFSDMDSVVTAFAPELAGLKAMVFPAQWQRKNATVITFTCKKPIQLLVGYFRDDQMKYAKLRSWRPMPQPTITVRQSHSSPAPSASTVCHR